MKLLKTGVLVFLSTIFLDCGSDSPALPPEDVTGLAKDTNQSELSVDQFTSPTDTTPEVDPGTAPDLELVIDLGGPAEPDLGTQPDTQNPPPVPPTYQMADECADPLNYTTPACAQKECPENQVCMGNGYCVPATPFKIEPIMGAALSKLSLAAADDGGFAAAWYEIYTPEGSSQQKMDVFFGIYQANGDAVFPPIKVNIGVLAWARSPSIVRLHDGNYMVVWREQAGNTQGELRYFGRVISPAGVLQSALLPLNETELELGGGTGGNVDAAVARVLRSGNVAIAWAGKPLMKGNSDVFARVLTSEGEYVTDEIDTGANSDGREGSPIVTETPQHGLVLLWQIRDTGLDEASPNLTVTRIFSRHFDSSMTPLNEPTLLALNDTNQENMPAAASFTEGQILVSWRSVGSGDNTKARPVHAMLYSPMGIAIGGHHELGEDASGGYPFNAPTSIANEGRAAVIWHSLPEDDDMIYLRRYYLEEDAVDCEATPVWAPLLENEVGARHLPDLLGFDDGRFLVAWSSLFSDPVDGQIRNRVVLHYLK